ncbi:MAG: IS1595 family transposase [Flavobacteriales bacterium]|nr:IS1595 family transposase [Flavobacteriales bacterium]
MDFQFSSLDSFEKAFPTEEACVAYFAAKRWGSNGPVVCPYCECDKCYTLKGKVKRFKCSVCKTLFSVKVGSIFEDSNLPLRVWFRAIYFATNSKGVSSVTLGKFLGRPQKTAWHILTKIRVMLAEVAPAMLDGEVEVDETFHGGLSRNKHAKKRTARAGYGDDKATILGLVQRGGKAIIQPVADRSKAVLQPIMREHVVPGATVYTDEHKSYVTLRDAYDHQCVHHGKGEYVRVSEHGTKAHTNTIEGAWASFKRTMVGTYHYASRKHLSKYCVEVAYRYNFRKDTIQQRFDEALVRSKGRTITYKEIIAG